MRNVFTTYTNSKSLSAIKNSGPSPRGKGHGFSNAESLGEIKYSGPSQKGKGHDFPTVTSLGNIKNSGPSFGGKGHPEYPNAEYLGIVKSSNSGLIVKRL
ncbi:hypothetical protein Hanom_Chr11g00978061 [Helianthus anomalus]